MSTDPRVAELLARWAERREMDGRAPDIDELVGGESELASPLRRAVARYTELEGLLERGGVASAADAPAGGSAARPSDEAQLPHFEGFRTIERLGVGGMGEVYKLVDRKLGRTVAAKVLRRDSAAALAYGDFLREARAMALFSDPRIVQIYEYREGGREPVILMEHVDGFELGRLGPSLEHAQRARIVAEIAEALHRAHELGLQHRDLKPANVLLDAELRPKILDFGLSGGDPRQGHGVGTLAYLAPEQLDPGEDLDARTDVYALGVLFYELLCGEPPYGGAAEAVAVEAIRRGQPRLPVEMDPAVPEPLQAIALKAMEREPAQRYASAREMAREIRRWLDGRPVLARPSLYASALERRVRPHLEQIRDWLALKLIYPHEAGGLLAAYRRLEAREDDWIVHSRRLAPPRISLYLGAFLLLAGGLFYFAAHRFFGAVEGLAGPLLALGLPFAGLSAAAFALEGKRLPGVAVAYYLAAATLLPLLLLIVFHEAGWWAATEGQFFAGGEVSNRQLQVAVAAACLWTLGLALRTRTVALSSIFAVLLLALALAATTDLGLRTWLDEGRWDLLSLHLAPLLPVAAGLGRWMERAGRPWLTTPLYLGGAAVFALLLELLALDGRAFAYLGVSLAPWQPAEVSDPLLLDTLAAMTANGLLFYATAWALERSSSEIAAAAARLLFIASPFATLEPVAYLCLTTEYSPVFNWAYLALALGLAFLSQHRQRKSFYYAGLLNTGSALLLIADRYEWFDVPGWALAVLGAGLATLGAGVVLELAERHRRRGPQA